MLKLLICREQENHTCINITDYWDVMPASGYKRQEQLCSLIHQYTCIKLHSITSQKAIILKSYSPPC